ncbi:MAG: hypothetical protein AAGD01_09470 [Acidobacteriota bacterium]
MSKAFWCALGAAVCDKKFCEKLLGLRRGTRQKPPTSPSVLVKLRGEVNDIIAPHIDRRSLVTFNRCLWVSVQGEEAFGEDGIIPRLRRAIIDALPSGSTAPDPKDVLAERDFQVLIGYLCVDLKMLDTLDTRVVAGKPLAKYVDSIIDVSLDDLGFEEQIKGVVTNNVVDDLVKLVDINLWRIIDLTSPTQSLKGCESSTALSADDYKVATEQDVQSIVFSAITVNDALRSLPEQVIALDRSSGLSEEGIKELLRSPRVSLDEIEARYTSFEDL